MDLSTTYLGFHLDSPLVAGASPLADTLDGVKRLEQAGCPLIQVRSLFEEQILNEQFRQTQDVEAAEDTWYEALTYYPRTAEYRITTSERYLEHISRIKETVSIPVVASLNGSTPGGWVEYARYLEEAGADAIELNVYFLSSATDDACGSVEERVVGTLREVRKNTSVPLAVKLSPSFSALPNLISRLQEEGAAGVVLFNRFLQPDLDVDELEVVPTHTFSDSSELLLRLRWLAMLSGRFDLSLACSGGAHTAVDAVKAIMCGAHAVQMVSVLLRHGPEYLGRLREALGAWMEKHEYESMEQMRGSMNLLRSPDPAAFERANYIRIIQGGIKYV